MAKGKIGFEGLSKKVVKDMLAKVPEKFQNEYGKHSPAEAKEVGDVAGSI